MAAGRAKCCSSGPFLFFLLVLLLVRLWVDGVTHVRVW